MSRYDDLFEDATVENSVFADKGALDPLAEPTDVVPRTKQEKKLAGLLTGVQEGHLPTTISVYGPPGTGKTLTTRRLCQEFAARTAEFEYEYVNLKECRTLFSAANEVLFELTGERVQALRGSRRCLRGNLDRTRRLSHLDGVDSRRDRSHHTGLELRPE